MVGELLPRGLVLAGRAVGFCLWKDLWPVRLAMVYPRWSLDPAAPLSYVPTLLLVAVLAGLWLARARAAGDEALAGEILARVELFRAGKP